MRKRESPFNPVLGFWLVGALVVIVAFAAYLRLQRAALPPSAPAGQVVDAVSPLPTASPPSQPIAPTPPAIAACTFKPDAKAAPQSQTPLQLALSAPQTVLTDTHRLRIGGWSPDGTRLLLARWERVGQSESIDAFILASHELQPFATRRRIDGLPFWDQAGKATLYVESYIDVSSDKNSNIVPLQLVRVEVGDAKREITAQNSVIAKDLVSGPEAANLNPRDGSVTLFQVNAPSQPIVVIPDSGQVQRAEMSLPALTLGSFNTASTAFGFGDPYRVAWNPKGTVLAFYNIDGFFLYNTETNRLCQVDIGQMVEQDTIWALEARWSSSGRYLAILKVPGQRPFRHMWLEILDTFDGTLRTIEAPTNVTTMRWLTSDERGLIFAQRVPNSEGIGNDTLMLADPKDGRNQPLTSDMTFGSLDNSGFEISPDGKQLALPCPIRDSSFSLDSQSDSAFDTLCLMEIKVLQ